MVKESGWKIVEKKYIEIIFGPRNHAGLFMDVRGNKQLKKIIKHFVTNYCNSIINST